MSDKPVLLITRPEPQASRSARFFQENGYDTRIVPVLVIEHLAGPADIERQCRARKYDAVVITSQHALFGLETLGELHGLPLYVPGEATATLARAIGFRDVIVGKGTARDLAKEIHQKHVLYLSGHDIAFDMVTELKRRKIDADEMKVYRAETNVEGIERLKDLIAKEKIDVVLFYSSRTARLFEAMMRQAKVTNAFKTCKAAVISQATAESLREVWQARLVARTPDEKGLLQAVKEA
ncbi:MAG: uroporphyrinogen-III synthase [Rickettsiales bacterium]